MLFITKGLHTLIHFNIHAVSKGFQAFQRTVPLIRIEDYIESVCSVHLSTFVEAPVPNFGGLMVCGPPGTLKSTIVKTIDSMDKGLCLSTINMTTFRALVNDIANKKIRTLAFEEFASIYAGDPRTASRVESTLSAMAEQGHSTLGLQDERMQRLEARAAVIGAMVPEFHESKYKRWDDNGFHRRFLWSLIRVHDPDKLINSVVEWQRLDIPDSKVPNIPLSLRIKDSLSTTERRELLRSLKKQPGSDQTTQLRTLCKMTSALAWWYSRTNDKKKDAMKTMRGFCTTLGKHGGELVL